MENTTWTELKPMNIARLNARAMILDGLIYVIGGYCYTDDDYSNIIEIYDPDSDEWHQLLQPRSPCIAILFKSNSVLHLIGDDTDWSQTIVERYDAAEKCWTKVRYLFLAEEVLLSIFNAEFYLR